MATASESSPLLGMSEGSGSSSSSAPVPTEAGSSASPPVPPASEAVVARLRLEAAPPAEWRREALVRHAAGGSGRDEECSRILEAALEADGLGAGDGERAATLHLLASQIVGRAVSLFSEGEPREKLEALLTRAKLLLDRADALEASGTAGNSLETLLARGFHSLARNAMLSPKTMNNTEKEGDDLTRAGKLFDNAMQLDATCPRALLGKAIVCAQRREWGKALEYSRKVLQRAAPLAPKSGHRLQCLKNLRFAMSTFFLGLGRFEQTKNALAAVVAADPGDVESLCALAHLKAKESEGGDESMEYLGEAVKADRGHPVVLCQAANHAFYCGLEDGVEGIQQESDGNGGPAPWKMAEEMLQKALASSKSSPVLAEVHYQLGRLRHAKGDFIEAYSEYRSCCNLQPEHFAGVFGLAQTCLQSQRLDEAIAALENCRQSVGDSPEILKLLTFAYLATGSKAKEAAKCADAYVLVAKDDVEGWVMRAEAHDQSSGDSPDAGAPKIAADSYEQVGRLFQGEDAKRYATPQMWNNLGTMRSLQGDTAGAREAYGKGLELADELRAELALEDVQGAGATDEKSAGERDELLKDLQVAQLTMRFNRAWLSEGQQGQPDFAQATQEYLQLSEEHNWYADTLLQLGTQWQRLGQAEPALKSFQEASKQSPFLGALMQSETYRLRGDYPKALESAEVAVQKAGQKQFHYAHVYLGNLYFEVATGPLSRSKENHVNMNKALRNFTKALQHEKDSHYASNGIGMVFARRGKIDFARRTFQSVMQHHSMGKEPCVYVNLGHTYMKKERASVRKAIALYEKAKKLKPDDLSIRLYIAKAYFGLKEYEHCIGVLGDATQMWPEDTLLRYNMAAAVEGFGRHLVSHEKKNVRISGLGSGMDQMLQAVELLDSAARLWSFVHIKWTAMSDDERKLLLKSSGAPENLAEEMNGVQQRKSYCFDIRDQAKKELDGLMQKRLSTESKVQQIQDARRSVEEERAVQDKEEARKREEKRLEVDEHATRLNASSSQIRLGKNLEQLKENKAPGKPVKGRPTPQQASGQGGGDEAGEDDPDDIRPIEGAAGDEIGQLDDGEVQGRPGKKEKKNKKEKKHKKDGKKDKKKRKHAQEDDREEAEGDLFEEEPVVGEEVEEEQLASLVGEAVGADAAGVGLPLDEGGDEAVAQKEKKGKEKKDKKHKSDKKEKKHKSDKKEKKDKRQKVDEGGSDDQGMEEELFGSDD